MYETILVPTDGSEHADRVAEHAIDVARTRGATVHVLSVVDDRAFLVLPDERVEAIGEELREGAVDAVERTTDAAAEAGVEVATAVETGHPAERILAYVDENDVDLVVMGTSGDDYASNVVGSVSRQVVQSAPVPVLTVGPDA